MLFGSRFSHHDQNSSRSGKASHRSTAALKKHHHHNQRNSKKDKSKLRVDGHSPKKFGTGNLRYRLFKRESNRTLSDKNAKSKSEICFIESEDGSGTEDEEDIHQE